MPIGGNLIDPLQPRPILLEDGSLEDDLNGDGIVDLEITAESYSDLFFDAGDGLPGTRSARHPRLLIDTDFDGEADLYVGTGYQVRSGEEDFFALPSENEADQDDDGVADTWTIVGVNVCYKDGDDWFVFSQSATISGRDADSDGRIDRWLTESAFHSIDNDGDGVIETWVRTSSVSEIDTDADGTADLRDSSGDYVGLDETGDGIIDVTYHYGRKIEELTEAGWVLTSEEEATFEVAQVVPNEYFYVI